jgi:alpha-L-rhamnosidase
MHRIRRDGNRFSVGFLGLRVLFHVLSDFGESELAYDMITRTEYPSYGHLVQQGCTTLTENFRTSGGVMQSLNHHFYGDVNHWFVRQVVGLHVNPYDRSCNEVLIHPHFVEKVDHASFTYELPKGKISVAWARQDDGTIRLEVHAAPGIVGQIRLDDDWRCTPHWYSYDILKPDTVLTIRKGYR